MFINNPVEEIYMVTTRKKPQTENKVATKATTRKATTRKASARKSATKKTQTPAINYQQRYQMIAEAAYHIAEKQDFMPENELEHWLQAETQIDNWISSENIQLSS